MKFHIKIYYILHKESTFKKENKANWMKHVPEVRKTSKILKSKEQMLYIDRKKKRRL